MKFALISNASPPGETASAVVIYRLLQDLDPGSYCRISSKDHAAGEWFNYFGELREKYYYLRPLIQFSNESDLRLRAAVEVPTFIFSVVLRARAIARVLKREKCDAVVACQTGSEVQDFPAAYLASRFVGVRFYAYLLDHYTQMASYGLRKTFLRRFEAPIMKGLSAFIESPIMRGASAIITHNEFERDELLRRYNVQAVVIHNACDLRAYERTRPSDAESETSGSKPTRIVFTGGVGALHYQAFRNLVSALELLDRNEVKVHLYTYAASELNCQREGIRGPVVFHPHEIASAMPAIQQQADILFLALSFESLNPEVIRTAAPGKMGEYLAARRPILVHAPSDSFIAWYFRHYECGLVVDENDPKQLAAAIELLLTDPKLRERLSERAWERARADFDLAKARAQFVEVIKA